MKCETHGSLPFRSLARGDPRHDLRAAVNRALKSNVRKPRNREGSAALPAHGGGRKCVAVRPRKRTRVTRGRKPSSRNAGLAAVSIIRSGHRENERACGACIGVRTFALPGSGNDRGAGLAPLVPHRYYPIEKPLPFIYDESESNFPLRHNCATIFFIGQHGRVS